MKETVELDLGALLKFLSKRIWIILLCTVLLGASVFVYTVNFVTPMYDASVTIYVNNNSNKNNDTISSSDLAVALKLVNTYVNIIESDTVLEKVIDEAGMNLTAKKVRGMLSAAPVDETEMFKVTIRSQNPQMSADLANAIARIAPGEIAAIIEGSSAKIIDYAKVPTTQSSPNPVRNTVLGAVLGAVLAVAVLTMVMLLDQRIKDDVDLQRVCGAPILGYIPDLAEEAARQEKKARR